MFLLLKLHGPNATLDLNQYPTIENVINSTSAHVIGNNLNNLIEMDTSANASTIDRNGGNDTIIGAFGDTLNGGDGNDLIRALPQGEEYHDRCGFLPLRWQWK